MQSGVQKFYRDQAFINKKAMPGGMNKVKVFLWVLLILVIVGLVKSSVYLFPSKEGVVLDSDREEPIANAWILHSIEYMPIIPPGGGHAGRTVNLKGVSERVKTDFQGRYKLTSVFDLHVPLTRTFFAESSVIEAIGYYPLMIDSPYFRNRKIPKRIELVRITKENIADLAGLNVEGKEGIGLLYVTIVPRTPEDKEYVEFRIRQIKFILKNFPEVNTIPLLPSATVGDHLSKNLVNIYSNAKKQGVIDISTEELRMICKDITDEEFRDSCYGEIGIEFYDFESCDKIKGDASGSCFLKLGQDTRNAKACEAIISPSTQEYCCDSLRQWSMNTIRESKLGKDELLRVCNEQVCESTRGDCFIDVAYFLKDPSTCNLIKDQKLRDFCMAGTTS